MSFDFPKIDLHLHLDGAVQPETAFQLAKEEGIPMPADTVEEFRHFLTVTANCRSVNEYLARFEIPLKILQNSQALSRVTKELIVRLADEGLRYAEIRFAPQLHTRQTLTQQDAVEAVLEGRRQGLEEAPCMDANIILCAMAVGGADKNRHENIETVRLAAHYLGEGVVAVDLAGAEGLCPLSDYAEIFELARGLHVPFTCHAGDSQGPDTVRDALDFGTKRIGHGHHIFDDKQLCERAIREGVTLEVCPTSNIQCQSQPSYREHPLKALYDMGMRVTVNTDNPVLSGITLDHEYEVCLKEMGFTEKDLIQMNLYSAEAAFLAPEKKAKLIQELKSLL